MGKTAISVIVPILNTVEYAKECLDSICNQTLKDIEILCVDGGSTDGSLELLQEYARQDERVHVIQDTKRSYGKQVNRGVELAKGSYIAIAEPDDYLSPIIYETLYKEAIKFRADIVKCNYACFVGNDDSKQIFPKRHIDKKWYGRDISAPICRALFDCPPANWSGIYRREFLLKNEIRHNTTSGATFQDTGFWFMAIVLAKKIRFVEEIGYYYRLDNPGSSIHASDKMLRLWDEFDDIDRQLKERHMEKEYEAELLRIKWIHGLWGLYRTNDETKEAYLQRMQKEFEGISRNKLKEIGFDAKQISQIEELKESCDSFLNTYYAHKKELFQQIKVSNNCLLFGCGMDGINFLLLMKESQLLSHFCAIVDNNIKLHGARILGLEVLAVEEGLEKNQGALFIIASARYEKEMESQLLNAGISEERIIIEHIV